MSATEDDKQYNLQNQAPSRGPSGQSDSNIHANVPGDADVSGVNKSETSFVPSPAPPAPRGQYTFPVDEENEDVVFGRRSNVTRSVKKLPSVRMSLPAAPVPAPQFNQPDSPPQNPKRQSAPPPRPVTAPTEHYAQSRPAPPVHNVSIVEPASHRSVTASVRPQSSPPRKDKTTTQARQRTPEQIAATKKGNRFARQSAGGHGQVGAGDVSKMASRVEEMRKYVKTWVRSEGRRRAQAATVVAAAWRGHAVRIALNAYLPQHIATRLRRIRRTLRWHQHARECHCRPCVRLGHTGPHHELKAMRDRYITTSQLRALTLRQRRTPFRAEHAKGQHMRAHAAAVRVQAVFRGWYTRRLYHVHRYQYYAATLIQSVWRGSSLRSSTELRLLRQEACIRRLADNVDRVHRANIMLHRKLEQETAARTGQEEAMRFLWEQVQDLVAARGGSEAGDMTQSPASSVQSTPRRGGARVDAHSTGVEGQPAAQSIGSGAPLVMDADVRHGQPLHFEEDNREDDTPVRVGKLDIHRISDSRRRASSPELDEY